MSRLAPPAIALSPSSGPARPSPALRRCLYALLCPLRVLSRLSTRPLVLPPQSPLLVHALQTRVRRPPAIPSSTLAFAPGLVCKERVGWDFENPTPGVTSPVPRLDGVFFRPRLAWAKTLDARESQMRRERHHETPRPSVVGCWCTEVDGCGAGRLLRWMTAEDATQDATDDLSTQRQQVGHAETMALWPDEEEHITPHRLETSTRAPFTHYRYHTSYYLGEPRAYHSHDENRPTAPSTPSSILPSHRAPKPSAARISRSAPLSSKRTPGADSTTFSPSNGTETIPIRAPLKSAQNARFLSLRICDTPRGRTAGAADSKLRGRDVGGP
ncbi:hypothetical protein EIP91_008356 [Steccherinum ochraceum]|uniref:Uncharacterized protein n=1 Tax=Steccherinum ochraceum TaxID=92696 RepID=A0A4R0RQ00_9APHY|nr:hypothetical protein EIP91_008356 [Steccherinum ochraceum]